jgi:aspartate racemase
MKTIGLIGGMSWQSSLEYYRIINETVEKKLGGFHSAKSVMISVDFAEVEQLQHAQKWKEATQMMIEAAQSVEKAGAELLVICTNTMHKMAEEVQASIEIPLIHIVDVTGEAIMALGLRKVGLLGSRFTMEEDFYKERLRRKYGIDVLVPEEKDRRYIHTIIYHELCKGILRKVTQAKFKKIIDRLISFGAEGVILGCTEIPLLVKQKDYAIPLFDTTTLHAQAAVDSALK